MTPVTLPARLFAAAWSNVSLASSQDAERPALYKTVCIDDHRIVVAATKKDGEIQWREVTMRLGSLEDPAKPTLMPELDRKGLTLITDDLRIQLPVIEAPFPPWAHLWPTEERHAPAGRCAYDSERLALFSKFKDAYGKVSLTFTTAVGPTVVEVEAHPPVSGLLMPIRDEHTEAEAEDRDGELMGADA